jgi:hypothetical protein
MGYEDIFYISKGSRTALRQVILTWIQLPYVRYRYARSAQPCW